MKAVEKWVGRVGEMGALGRGGVSEMGGQGLVRW